MPCSPTPCRVNCVKQLKVLRPVVRADDNPIGRVLLNYQLTESICLGVARAAMGVNIMKCFLPIVNENLSLHREGKVSTNVTHQWS